jgi:uncharacterized membrane protein (UPF0127 family)
MRGPDRSVRAALVAFAVFTAPPAFAQSCDPGTADLRDPDSTARFEVEVMDTAEGRAQGLMNRESLGRFAGMLFVYDTAQPVAFWMENTLIPLDMLFFDETGRLQRIHENAVPLDRTPIPGGDDIQFVLEINGGLARTLGIEEGAELRHPTVDQSLAAWPCDAE